MVWLKGKWNLAWVWEAAVRRKNYAKLKTMSLSAGGSLSGTWASRLYWLIGQKYAKCPPLASKEAKDQVFCFQASMV